MQSSFLRDELPDLNHESLQFQGKDRSQKRYGDENWTQSNVGAYRFSDTDNRRTLL
jgi:hypothetical protein